MDFVWLKYFAAFKKFWNIAGREIYSHIPAITKIDSFHYFEYGTSY